MDKSEVQKMGVEFSVIGKKVRQKDGPPRVTGEAKYYSDVMLPNMLHTQILRSPYPQADIASIDTSEAENFSGVELVMTYQNFPGAFRKDLHFVGDYVAAVIAVDEETAEEACGLIKVTYDQKPFVLDLEEAMKPDAPRVFQDEPNVHDWEYHYYLSEKDPKSGLWTKKELSDFHGFGDIEKGFKEADVVVEETGIKYAYGKSPAMNPRGCLASFHENRLTVWTHSQGMHHERLSLSEVLGLSVNQINYVSPYIGASFGGKIATPGDFGTASRYLLIAGFATLALRKPVRCAYSRKEEMLCAWSRGTLTNLKIGFKKDGTLITMDMDHWVELGAGGDKWTIKNALAATGCTLYSRNCQHMRGKIRYVHTNRFLSVGWHGYGTPEGHFAVEIVMDKAAEVLNIGPIELRKMNHFRTGDLDQSYDPLTYKTCYISSSGITECLDKGAERVDWKNQWKSPTEKTGRIRHGLGMAIFTMCAGRPGPGNSTSAMVKVFPDATATLVSAQADLGQGQHTVQPQIVAEVLGLPYKNVRIVCHDTDSTPFASIVAASCGTWFHGWVSYEAAMEAKGKILELAARRMEANPLDLDIKDGAIFHKELPAKKISFEEAFGPVNIYGGTHEVQGYSYQETPHPKCAKDGQEDQIYIPKEKGAQFVSLDVDTETGELQNIKIVHLQNVGKALNPKIVEGQFLSARHGFENAALGCECIEDRQSGRLLNNNWEDYRPATILDCDMDPIVIEVPGDPTHPFGASACGEGPSVPTMAAFSNAIYNAIGVRIKETPFTPDRILKALGKIKE